ncbi:DUF975 family protein [Furfurilactobacillus sp. WILCCON 0119]
MRTRAELKQSVKDLFHGKWGKAVGLNVIPVLLLLLVNGYNRFYIRSNYDAASSSFIGLYQHLGTRTWWIILLATVIGFGVTYTFLDWVREPNREINPASDSFRVVASPTVFPLLVLSFLISFIVVVGYVLLVVPGIMFSLMYSQSIFVYKDLHEKNPDASIWAGIITSMRLSRQLMQGHKWEFFVLTLSFLGWALLAVPSFGFSNLWVTPYISGTRAAYYNDLEETSELELTL